MDDFYKKMLDEWSIDGSRYSDKKALELAIQCTQLHYLQSIEGILKSMKQQEKEYWEAWKKAKENE